jgi:prolyl oligopeptidase
MRLVGTAAKIILGAIVVIRINACLPSQGGKTVVDGVESKMEDPYLWLEEVEGEAALEWVKVQNKKTLSELHTDPRFSEFEAEALQIYEATDRIASVIIRGPYVYNFWQDDTNIRGIWRRSTLATYLQDAPTWEILLDVDALAQAESENWVYKSAAGLPPSYDRFLIELSRGGKDAVVVREFDVPSKSFVKNGFFVPEAKSTVSWISMDQLFVSTDFGPGSMTESGYPASIRLWNRGERLEESRELANISPEHVGAWGWTQFNAEESYSLISKSITFWTHEIDLLASDGNLLKLDIPEDADFQGIFAHQALMILRTPWEGHPAGSLVSKHLKSSKVEVIYTPDHQTSISGVNLTASHILLTIQNNVIDKVLAFSQGVAGWDSFELDLPRGGVISIDSASPEHEDFFFFFEDLLTPSSLGYLDQASAKPIILKREPARFDADGLEVSQEFAISKDGTSIPYFLVKRKDLPADGNNPVLLYGYGGFEVSQKPYYRKTTGKLWMEKGGVFALANIRGGGEYGPAWHQAALKQNRHVSYEDFIAVGEALITKGITCPEKLGIMGGSGGGLLVGAVYTMRPDLFGAMVSQVPLLDMLRYHKLLAGASWMGEYGDPDVREEAAYLRKYSPYHNILPGTNYARALFTTSTKDDRVHPGHARKMVARLMEQGHPVMYYENMEGGHAAGANLKQYATMAAIEYTYLHRQLGL